MQYMGVERWNKAEDVIREEDELLTLQKCQVEASLCTMLIVISVAGSSEWIF